MTASRAKGSTTSTSAISGGMRKKYFGVCDVQNMKTKRKINNPESIYLTDRGDYCADNHYDYPTAIVLLTPYV